MFFSVFFNLQINDFDIYAVYYTDRLCVMNGLIDDTQSRRKNPPPNPPAGGLTWVRGLMLRMKKNFPVFQSFQNICEDIRA